MSGRGATKQWSRVLAARDGSDTQARAALESLCQTYWQPLYAYIRAQGHGPEEARDPPQGFFTEFLDKDFLSSVDPDKGRFRSYEAARASVVMGKAYLQTGVLESHQGGLTGAFWNPLMAALPRGKISPDGNDFLAASSAWNNPGIARFSLEWEAFRSGKVYVGSAQIALFLLGITIAHPADHEARWSGVAWHRI